MQKAVDATKRSVELVQIQYKEGETDFNQVFVLESNLVDVQDRLVVAQANIAIALTIAYKALGGGWQLRTEIPYQGAYPLDVASPNVLDTVELEMMEILPVPAAAPLDAAEESDE